MVHWLEAAGGLIGTAAGWRWIVRPLRRAWRELIALLRQIRMSSTAYATLAMEVQALSGAVVNLAVSIVDEQRQLRHEHDELREQHQQLTALVIDLDADVRRLQRGAADVPD